MSSVSTLPPEVLLEIFQYLPPLELLDSVQHVCSEWRELARHPSLWQHFVLSQAHGATLDDAVSFVEKCPMLKHIRAYLWAYKCPVVGPGNLVDAVVKNCSDLRSFCVHFECTTFTAAQVDSLFEAFPNLESFYITISIENADGVVDRLAKCTKLKELTLECDYYCDGMIMPVIDGCVSLENLQIYSLAILNEDLLYILQTTKDRLLCLHLWCSTQSLQDVIDALANFTRLEDLTMAHCGPQLNKHVNYRPLTNIKTMKSLTFFSSAEQNSALDPLFESLFNNPFPLLQKINIEARWVLLSRNILKDLCRCYPKLKSLCLCYKQLDDFRDSCKEICRLQQLVNLEYHDMLVTDDDVKHLAQCRGLKHLRFVRCPGLTDESIVHLGGCESLESLDITECLISGESLHLFVDRLKRLKLLRVKSNTVVYKYLHDLGKKFPSLNIRSF